MVMKEPSMGEIVSALTNLGISALMAAALIWFLHYVVTRTLPEMNKNFRQQVAAERVTRRRENKALLQMMDRMSREQHAEHAALMDHLDVGLKELARVLAENQAEVLQRLDALVSAGQRPGMRPKPP